MRTLLTHILNIIFPPRSSEKIIQDIHLNKIDNLYSPGLHQSNIYLCSYQNSIIKSAIIENKFHKNKKASLILGNLLEKWTKHQISSTLYIPIPLGPQRLRKRGYNQIDCILENDNLNIKISRTVLTRIKDTPPQSKLDKNERLKNIKGTFTFNKSTVNFDDYEQIVIVDDVVTTGATLEAARAELAPHLPPHITLRCLAIAH